MNRLSVSPVVAHSATNTVMESIHLTDEALEHYLLRRSLSEEDIQVIETHLVSCERCQNRCQELETQVEILRSALERKSRETLPSNSLFLVVGKDTPRSRNKR